MNRLKYKWNRYLRKQITSNAIQIYIMLCILCIHLNILLLSTYLYKVWSEADNWAYYMMNIQWHAQCTCIQKDSRPEKQTQMLYTYGYEIIYLSIKIHINVYTTLCRVLDYMRVLHLKCIPYIHWQKTILNWLVNFAKA